MTRQSSAAAIKQGRRTDFGKIPSPGSMARRLYDRLHEDPGHMVDVTDIYREANARSGGGFKALENTLTDFYGCDIRKGTATGRLPRTPLLNMRLVHYRMLAGEWYDSEYRDFCAEAFERESKKADL